MQKHVLATAAFTLALCAASASLADSAATAQALFDEARALMDRGKHAEACPKLKESHRLDPGGGTVLHLGLCYEKAGQTASAWASLNEALSLAKRDKRADRQKVAEERLAAVTPKLTRLKIDVSAGAAGASGLKITRGDVETSSAEWGTAVPVDPGEYVVRASAPGKKAWEQKVAVGEPGATVSVEVPELLDAPVEKPPAGEPPPAVRAASSEPTRDRGPAGGSSQKTIGWILGGAGVVGLAVGGYFGLESMSKKSDADAHCDGSKCRDQEGVDLRDQAIAAGNLSTVGFVAGGAALTAGVILILTAPEPAGPRAALRAAASPGFGGLVLDGRF